MGVSMGGSETITRIDKYELESAFDAFEQVQQALQGPAAALRDALSPLVALDTTMATIREQMATAQRALWVPSMALAVRPPAPPEPPPAAAAAAAEHDAAQWREVLSAAIAVGLAEPAVVVALVQSDAPAELRQFVSAYQVATGKRGRKTGVAIARRMSMSRATLYRRIAAARAAGLLP